MLVTGLPSVQRSSPLCCFLSLFTLVVLLCGNSNQFISFSFGSLLTHFSPCASHLVNDWTNHCVQRLGEWKALPSHSHNAPITCSGAGPYLQLSAGRRKSITQKSTSSDPYPGVLFHFFTCFRKWPFCFTNVTNNDTNHFVTHSVTSQMLSIQHLRLSSTSGGRESI